MSEETHWGPDPGHGGLTQHKGSRRDCSGPDCGSDEGSHFHQATRRLDASDYQWQESGFEGGLREALVAQVHSNLAIAVELRRSNEDRALFYATMREFFERLLEDPQPGPDGSPVGSGQPAAAPGCPVCERADSDGVCPRYTPLTRQQWRDHGEGWQRRMENMGATRLDAALWAERVAENWYGPCPEES